MTSQQAKSVLDELEGQCRNLCDIAKTARRNQKSLAGRNPYGQRFHEGTVALAKAEAKLSPVLAAAGFNGDVSGKLVGFLDTLRSPTAENKPRAEALNHVRMLCQATVLPAIEAMTASPVPMTEQVLPLDVVRGTRTYIEKVVIQANGSYEHGWYDSCSVMIRRIVETLIIEAYEAKGRSSDIQDGSGNYFMLRVLVDRILADSSWNLGRETRASLPDIKSLGDRSAHNRRYLCTKQDIDRVRSGLRVIADDLLHLAGLK
jgi:hypothetical protein